MTLEVAASPTSPNGKTLLPWSPQDKTDVAVGVRPHFTTLDCSRVARVTEHIEKNLDGRLLTVNLASMARLSVSHFTREFERTVGLSPHRYLVRRRIARAQMLMLTTDISLAQIAILCGMSDQAHLSRCFRQVVGHPPAAWRRVQLSSDLHSPNRTGHLRETTVAINDSINSGTTRRALLTGSAAVACNLCVPRRPQVHRNS
jgi:AraC-like DNA-binding protein